MKQGFAGIGAATPLAQPQQQQGVAGIHAAMTPTMVVEFKDFLEDVKNHVVHWRDTLNNHNTVRPRGQSVNRCIRDTIQY
ncbi:hypothetical protein N9L68_08700 [bacterium]|nr:hypothetical protein [bacterium]